MTYSAPIPARSPSLIELPLTPMQLRWWFLCMGYPGGSSPLVSIARRIRGPLVVEQWVRAVGALIDRHEILRAVFAQRETGPVQVIGPPQGLAVEMIDLTDLASDLREQRARELLLERRQRSLDLEHGPLVHSTLIKLGDDDHAWALTIHHILADGASLALIDRELSALYPAFVENTEPDVAELTVQYGDYAVWYSMLDSEQEEEDREYWRDQLADAPSLHLRAALPRPIAKGAPAGELTHVMGDGLAKRVEELAIASRSTRFMVLLAGLYVLLSRYSGQTDFCVGIPVAGVGRTRPELGAVVGLFNNTLALRCDLSGDPTFREHLVGTRGVVLDAFDHQDLAWGQVVTELKVPHDPGMAQVFQVMFLLDELSVGREMALPGLEITDFTLAIPKVLHDLMVFVWPSPGGLTTRFVYDTGILPAGLVDELANDYEKILRAAIADPDARISAFAA